MPSAYMLSKCSGWLPSLGELYWSISFWYSLHVWASSQLPVKDEQQAGTGPPEKGELCGSMAQHVLMAGSGVHASWHPVSPAVLVWCSCWLSVLGMWHARSWLLSQIGLALHLVHAFRVNCSAYTGKGCNTRTGAAGF